ncbi:MAG: hypothetical protein ACR2FM_01285 [Candidatus Saccharimonadales bacterium]
MDEVTAINLLIELKGELAKLDQKVEALFECLAEVQESISNQNEEYAANHEQRILYLERKKQ